MYTFWWREPGYQLPTTIAWGLIHRGVSSSSCPLYLFQKKFLGLEMVQPLDIILSTQKGRAWRMQDGRWQHLLPHLVFLLSTFPVQYSKKYLFYQTSLFKKLQWFSLWFYLKRLTWFSFLIFCVLLWQNQTKSNQTKTNHKGNCESRMVCG